jgi:signal peptidase I
MSTSLHFIQRVLYTGALSLPVVIYVNDCWFTLATVRGTSMEPTLQSGDVVLVRKADFFPFFSAYRSSRIRVRDLTNEDEVKQNKSVQMLQEVSDLQHSLQVERSLGKAPIHELTWKRSPPMVLPGDVVVYQNKHTFQPLQMHIHRVVGVGGQQVRQDKR